MIEKSRASRELSEINSVQKTCSQYYIENNTYPTANSVQPDVNAPVNIDFTVLVPNYLAKLPNFSLWWISNEPKVYHTEYGLGSNTN